MKAMDYLELSCRLSELEPWREIMIAQLADIGFESFLDTFDGFKAYIPAGDFNEKLVDEALTVPQSDPNPLVFKEITTIGAINWNKEWERNFKAVDIGEQVHIRAPFHSKSESALYDIVIEPKMSFGTGHHETTRLAMEWLIETDLSGKSVLDMGCGTGVLAIFASMKGASKVVAIDNYLFAYQNTIDNAIRNNQGHIRVLHGDAKQIEDDKFDVVVANITKNVLLEDMSRYRSALNAGGMMILSGFLGDDKEAILQHACDMNLIPKGEKTLSGWVAVRLEAL